MVLDNSTFLILLICRSIWFTRLNNPLNHDLFFHIEGLFPIAMCVKVLEIFSRQSSFVSIYLAIFNRWLASLVSSSLMSSFHYSLAPCFLTFHTVVAFQLVRRYYEKLFWWLSPNRKETGKGKVLLEIKGYRFS